MLSINSTDVKLDPVIEDMVTSLNELDSEEAIENALCWLRRECQCERAMFYQFRGATLLSMVTSNIDPDWKQVYRKQRMLTHDPVVKCYRDALGFVDWGKACQLYEAPDTYHQAVKTYQLERSCSYGYTCHGYPFQGVTSVCSLNGLSRTLNANDKYLMSSLVPVLHLVGRGVKFRCKGLTPKELEVLAWVREGKTSAEIASIRKVSEATIKYHLKSIYNKLGASNRAQAVGEALCQGLIK